MSFFRPQFQAPPDRIFYLSGPHGSGKSTLVQRLSEIHETEVVEQLAHMESLQEIVERAIWRIALHAIEHRKNLAKMSANPRQIIIGDRCYVDDVVYLTGFKNLGWITPKQYDEFIALMRATYVRSGTPLPQNAIMLCPPLDWNVNRVIERQQATGEVKWREADFHYLSVINGHFHAYAQGRGERQLRISNLLRLVETDLDKRIQQIRQWIAPSTPAPSQAGTAFVEAGRRTYRQSGGTD